MAIRKYGNEPAQTEVRAEDNDQETLDYVRKAGASSEIPASIDMKTDEDRRRPRR